MDHRCPHCDASLKWKLIWSRRPSSGTGKVHLACPRCNGGLMVNQHSREISLGLVAVFFAVVPNTAAAVIDKSLVALGICALGLIGLVVVAVIQQRTFKGWRRYTAYAA